MRIQKNIWRVHNGKVGEWMKEWNEKLEENSEISNGKNDIGFEISMYEATIGSWYFEDG